MKAKELKEVKADNYLTVEEAAKLLGIKSGVLRNYLHKNKLTTYKFKKLTLLSTAEVRNWQSKQR